MKTPDNGTRKIRLCDIRADGDTQPRARMDNLTISEYAEEVKAKRKFPPLEVYYDGATYWLVDGFHRHAAYLRENISQVDVVITQGSLEEARWASLNKNHSHGLRRTNEDKRKAVETALKMKPEMSDAVIAEWCGVHINTVASTRKQVTQNVGPETPRQPQKRTGKDGKQYPARPPVYPPMPPDSEEKEPPKSTTPPAPTDAIGRIIPPAAMETWNRKGEAVELLEFASRIRVAIKKAQENHDPFYGELSLGNLLADIDSLYGHLKLLKPYTVCPNCQGMTGCRLCNDRRMVSQFKWEHSVSDIQKQRALEEVGHDKKQ